MFAKPKEEPDLTGGEKFKMFMAAHWRGVLIVLIPLILLPILTPFPALKWQWTAYTLLIMAIFWVAEIIPLAVTGFLPIVVFPFTDVMDSETACKAYVNDSVIMFLASLILAASIEQSGLHKRLAYFAIRVIGYSHAKLLLAMCCVTTFVSMWITNTAATSMMVPILFALLRVFENEGIIKIYETGSSGQKEASDITSCYFCAATYSATIGGIGTIVGTGTNLAFKSLFASEYVNAPEYLSFPNFSAFAVPYMIVLEFFCYMYFAIFYFGLFRPKSKVAISSKITDKAKAAAQITIETQSKKIGSLSFWEFMVIILFGTAIIGFFSRSPQIFVGWGDAIVNFYGEKNQRFIKDSACAMIICFAMCLLPSSLLLFKNFTAKHQEDLPKTSIVSVLDWGILQSGMPYSFMFLLGGGIALSRGAKSSGLNDKLGDSMGVLASLPNSFILLLIIVLVTFVTNFASNVAVINVFGPIAMTLAEKLKVNPLWYIVASGFSASYCFMIAVGTPGNLVVKVVASIPVGKMVATATEYKFIHNSLIMSIKWKGSTSKILYYDDFKSKTAATTNMKAGFGPTISTIIITWLAVYYWAPVIWPDLKKPFNDLDWMKNKL